MGHVVKGDIASFAKGDTALCILQNGGIVWFLNEYVLNLLQGELHTLHAKGLFEKKTCVSKNCLE